MCIRDSLHCKGLRGSMWAPCRIPTESGCPPDRDRRSAAGGPAAGCRGVEELRQRHIEMAPARKSGGAPLEEDRRLLAAYVRHQIRIRPVERGDVARVTGPPMNAVRRWPGNAGNIT